MTHETHQKLLTVEKTAEIALAALLHDVGKLLQRGFPSDSYSEIQPLIENYCPYNQSENRFTHHHAAYTAWFIQEYLSHLIPEGAGDQHILTWAARHHSAQSAAELLIERSDHLASGLDRSKSKPDIEYKQHFNWGTTVLKCRLDPVLQYSSPESSYKPSVPRQIPLKFHSLNREDLFPMDMSQLSEEQAAEDYKELGEQFCVEAKRLLPGLPVIPLIETVMGLMERYMSAVPAATTVSKDEPNDVSLYDHSRITAAIASVLHARLMDEQVPEDQVSTWLKDDQVQRYALVISAGLVGDHPNRPLLTLAERAGYAEKQAKSQEIRGKYKNAISILNRTLTWSEFQLAAAMTANLVGFLKGSPQSKLPMNDNENDDYQITWTCLFETITNQPIHSGKALLPRGFLMKLNAIAQIEHDARKKRIAAHSIEDVKSAAKQERWSWMAAYTLTRAAERGTKELKTFLIELQNTLFKMDYNGIKGSRTIIEYLEVIAGWAAIITRKERKE